MRHRLTPLLALLAATAACKVVPSPDASGPAAAKAAIAATLGDTVRIPVGQVAGFDHGRLTVAFEALEAESRCPTNVQCIQAGDAQVRLRLQTGDRKQPTSLHTNGQPRTTDFYGYTVALADVEPHPGAYPGAAVAPPATALVVVTRQQ